MKILKLGIIGAGFIARFQAQAVSQIRNVKITGVYSRTAASAEQFAKLCKELEVGDCRVCQSVAELTQHVDAVAIFSPNFTRVSIVEEIVDTVKKGAHLKGLICEKPLARNLIEARKLLSLIDEIGLPTAYFENQLFMKLIRAQMQQLRPQQEQMGPLLLTRCSEEHGGPHEPWFWDPTQQGGGVLSDMGCHSIAVGWYALTPHDQPLDFLQPVSVSCDCALLKWGAPKWRKQLLDKFGIDYGKIPAEDFTTGIITYKNPVNGRLAKAQFTNSWMFEKQGLRLFMDGMGPGYAFEINTLNSSLQVFVGDAAADAVADSESALEKSTASRGLLSVQHNEADLYGYTDELKEAAAAFLAGQNGFLPWRYGYEITKLVMAAYMADEQKKTIDLTDVQVQTALENYIPLIQQGKGREVLYQ